MALIGKNIRFDQHSPGKHDQLNLLIVNILRWSAKTGGRWSDDPFCPGGEERIINALQRSIVNALEQLELVELEYELVFSGAFFDKCIF